MREIFADTAYWIALTNRPDQHHYVTEFAGWHNIRDLDAVDQMAFLAQVVIGKRFPCRELTA